MGVDLLVDGTVGASEGVGAGGAVAVAVGGVAVVLVAVGVGAVAVDVAVVVTDTATGTDCSEMIPKPWSMASHTSTTQNFSTRSARAANRQEQGQGLGEYDYEG